MLLSEVTVATVIFIMKITEVDLPLAEISTSPVQGSNAQLQSGVLDIDPLSPSGSAWMSGYALPWGTSHNPLGGHTSLSEDRV